MNLDHDFFQVSKSSEDEKKSSSLKVERFFQNSDEDQKKEKSSPKMEHFFPRIQVETCAQMHTGVKFLEGMHMKTILKLLEGIYPPGFRHPCTCAKSQ